MQTDYSETGKIARSLGVQAYFPSTMEALNYGLDGMCYSLI